MAWDRRGYEAAARTKHSDPQRREDALDLAAAVCGSDTRGVRRDWLRNRYRDWPEPRFRAALFYAYGLGWITFIGWTYVVDPGPGLPAPGPPPAPACRRDHADPAEGMFDKIGQITSTTSGKSPSTTKTK